VETKSSFIQYSDWTTGVGLRNTSVSLHRGLRMALANNSNINPSLFVMEECCKVLPHREHSCVI
jgi:hypothetical protein